MRRQIDEQKRSEWEQRLARFRSSGLTSKKVRITDHSWERPQTSELDGSA